MPLFRRAAVPGKVRLCRTHRTLQAQFGCPRALCSQVHVFQDVPVVGHDTRRPHTERVPYGVGAIGKHKIGLRRQGVDPSTSSYTSGTRSRATKTRSSPTKCVRAARDISCRPRKRTLKRCGKEFMMSLTFHLRSSRGRQLIGTSDASPSPTKVLGGPEHIGRH